MWIEQQRTEPCRGYGAGKGRQPAAERGGGVAGAELSANQTDVGAVSRRGAKALQHGNCGRVSNRSYSETFRQAVLDQVRTRYADFGPTLAAEHLSEEDGLEVAAETLRRWMKAAGLWRGQRRRKNDPLATPIRCWGLRNTTEGDTDHSPPFWQPCG
jgi:hypothetical protein